jgi:hypothetical protein
MKNNEQHPNDKTVEQCRNEMRASHQGKATRAFWAVAACRSIAPEVKSKPAQPSRKERRAAKNAQVTK